MANNAVNVPEIKKLRPKKILQIIKDPVASAKAVNLVYTVDASSEGINRTKKGGDFQYHFNGKLIKDEQQLQRIKSLVIPPAWENVWICALENGHLQATGLDARKRKQYRYHPVWNALRNHTKFYRMLQFGAALPQIRLAIEKDLALPGMQKRKVLAALVSLMERTNIRVGNTVYEKLYGSFGLTTLKDNHIKVEGNNIRFSFRGKKGVMHDISIRNRKLARIVQNCKDIPGKELFQYRDEAGNRQAVDSGMLNDYIREISGEDFTAKDFRTWSGTVNAFIAFAQIGASADDKETKKNIKECLDMVAANLGNTPTVCKKYYIHPLILSLYETRSISKYISQIDSIEKNDGKTGLTNEEKLVMKILEEEKM